MQKRKLDSEQPLLDFFDVALVGCVIVIILFSKKSEGLIFTVFDWLYLSDSCQHSAKTQPSEKTSALRPRLDWLITSGAA